MKIIDQRLEQTTVRVDTLTEGDVISPGYMVTDALPPVGSPKDIVLVDLTNGHKFTMPNHHEVVKVNAKCIIS